MKSKVVIGLSGGIDSTMAAWMLKKKGFEVIGLHFSLLGEQRNVHINEISNQLGIEVIQLDIQHDFEIVKEYFANEYLRGRTPSPCTFCNKLIKWKKLIDFANKNKCDFISSGHYIRKKEIDGFFFLQKGFDPIKDQSYFLWELESETIKRMINPLGDFTKNEVREMAKENGFQNLISRKESMGVCFLQDVDYRTFLIEYIPEKIQNIKQGLVRNESNEIIGSHEGYINYTIGQKRGLTLDIHRPAYVSSINAVENELMVGTKKSLLHHHIILKKIHLVNPETICNGSKVLINVRGLGLNPDEPATIKNIQSNTLELELSNPAWAVAPGQPVVFYDRDILLGGGIAEKSW